MSEAKENSWSTWPIICKTHPKYLYTTLANTNFIFREEPPSIWDILFMIPWNIVYPFLYIMDIVKDLVQFVLLVKAVGGLSLVLEYWSSFSSTVWNIYLVTLLTWLFEHQVILLSNKIGDMVYFACNFGSNHHCRNNCKKRGLVLVAT